MATRTTRTKLVAIVGPTASGKSALALRIAKDFKGEIICADSRTIYKDMDIGTAKPSKAEQAEVPHWGLDLVKPGEAFSAAKFKRFADAKIAEIQAKGKLPILVGGTGLYVDGVLYDFAFVNSKKPRLFYSWRSAASLQKIIKKRGWIMPENSQNRRHLIRTIERAGQVGGRQKDLLAGILLIGLLPSDAVLKQRIARRAEQMFEQGIVKETEGLLAKYGQRAIKRTGGLVYGITQRLIRSEIDQQEAMELFKRADWQYARRQKTWFRRNAHIKWFSSPDQAYKAVKKTILNT